MSRINFSNVVIFFSFLVFFSPLTYGKIINSDGFKYYIEATPNWVSKNTYALKNEDQKYNSDTDYLLADRQILAKDKNLVNFFRYAQKPLNISGLEKASTIKISFDPSYQKLVFHSVKLIREGQKINALKSKDIKLIQQEKNLNQGMVNGRVTALMLISSSKVGDIIDYSFSIEGQNPVFNNKYFVMESPEYGVPIAKSYFRFITASNKKFYSRLAGLSETDLKVIKKGQTREYVYEKEMTPAHEVESNLPTWFTPYPTIEISEFETWEQVAQWANKMYSPKEMRNKEVIQLIKKLKPLAKDQQIISALRFVQNEIRYMGLEIAINSHKPHHPDTVLKNRYGDCKDKTVLLISILKKLGINAYPALVNTRSRKAIASWQPMPGAFDHVITMVDYMGGEYWLDPTRTFQEGSLETMAYKSFNMALLLNHPRKTFVEMPAQKPDQNYQKTKSQYIVNGYDLPVDLTLTQTFYGNYADWKRAQFSTNSLYQLEEHRFKSMQLYHHDIIKINKLRVIDNKKKNEFSVITDYRINQFFDVQEDGKYYYNLNAFTIREQVDTTIENKRKQPYFLGGPALYEHQVAISFPRFNFVSYPKAVDKISTAQLDYTLTRDNVDLSQQFNHKLILGADYVPAEQSLVYKKGLQKIKVASFETWHVYPHIVKAQINKNNDAFIGFINKLGDKHALQN